MTLLRKVLFLDRDGTLIVEPSDEQVDSLDKLALVDRVVPALHDLAYCGYRFVIVTNQDGLGTDAYPRAAYDHVDRFMRALFSSQGIVFDEVLVCPHAADDGCLCRKPHLGLVRPYLTSGTLDLERSAVVGDRASDVDLARNMGLRGFRLGDGVGWPDVARQLVGAARRARVERATAETVIVAEVDLDSDGPSMIRTGIPFFDHMLEQLARHGRFALTLTAEGDLAVEAHHTVEDTAIVIGEALSRALGDRTGIARFGFTVPMDEAQARIALDLSGRPFLVFRARFDRPEVGGLPTEMIEHFYRSLSNALGATLHVDIDGLNCHHMIEASFKAMGRAFRQASTIEGGGLPSTKGLL